MPEGIQYQVQLITGLCVSARGHSIPSPADNGTVLVSVGIQYQVQLITNCVVVPEGIQYQVQLITGLCGSARGHSIPIPADNKTVWYCQRAFNTKSS